ncbi:ATP-binding cassette domain-containing protein [Bombilactobacillus bombi]|uniref:ATP-binding cassette domain-containing protein n=1 Tax=Bombilactobacillus bombi TaxID=1303590 RepID=UPI0015E5ABB7|nr:ABC transporter ATP-binding protein [Bombilactobacillus bombi]MBA1433901.1 ABC transporter ATP-binding protein [Bombilactobacillus bombi]
MKNNSDFYNVLWHGNHGRKLLIFIITIIRSTILLLPPILTKVALGSLIPNKRANELLVITLSLIIIPLMTCGLIILDLYLSSFVIKNSKEFREHIYTKYLSCFSIQLNKEEVIHRLLKETEQVTGMIFRGIGNLLWLSTTIAIGFALILFFNLKIGLILLLVNVFEYTFIYLQSYRLEKSNSKYLSQETSWNQILDTSFSGTISIRNNSNFAKFIKNRWHQQANSLFKSQLLINKQTAFLNLLQGVSEVICTLVIFLGLIWYVGSDSKVNTLANVVAIYQIYQWIVPAMAVLVSLMINFQENKPAIKRINELSSQINEATFFEGKGDITHPFPITIKDGSQLINGSILQGKVIINSGDRILISGKSGVGKSSLINTALLYPVDKKDNLWRSKIVTFNDAHFKDVSRKNWQNFCVIIPQNIKLYKMTLLDNICLGESVKNSRKVKEILKILHFSANLKDRLQEVIHPDGRGLSGGQIQMIGIARALIKLPKLIVFDESTSALDYKLEREIFSNIIKKYPKITFIFISHRNYSATQLFTRHAILYSKGNNVIWSERNKNIC